MKRVIGVMALGILAAAAVWTAGSLYVMKDVKSPAYEVLKVADGYEVRRYPAMLVARTEASGDSEADSLFRVLAGFIFGGNDQDQEIAMTAPVFMAGNTGPPGEQPLPAMQFIMPAQFTVDTLPSPRDERVEIREVPSRVIAARRFGWFAAEEVRREQLARLMAALERDGVTAAGEPVYAGYQPPFSVPFLKRHEMMVEVDWDDQT